MTEVWRVHEEILSAAAVLANERAQQAGIDEVRTGAPFRPTGDYTTFSLEIHPNFLAPVHNEQRKKELVTQLHQIAVTAVRDTLVDQKEKLVGVVLGEARQGRDYFERFQEEE